jgi:putative radical SAM enzyme (TIGR03279 family)
MVRIAGTLPDSVADEIALESGTRIVSINGSPVRDAVDLRYLETDERLELEVVAADGSRTIFEIEKPAGDPLGIVPEPDPVRQCANKCAFCFVDGNPAGARSALFLKDDDFRLSFTYGSYVTLTNLGPRARQRLIEQRLSPLYVSVHATEPDVRMRALGVPRGGDILADLRQLLEGGIEAHTQVVLCPELNDGEHLDRTVDDLWRLGPGVLSLSVVPVGLTRFNLNRPIRLLTALEAGRALDQVDRGRERATRERGIGWTYAADEMFFLAGRTPPDAAYYDDWPLTENGVGAVRRLLDAFEDGLDAIPRQEGARIAIVTGDRMGTVLGPLAERLRNASGARRIDVVPVRNEFFGPTVTTAGLLAGYDILDALGGPADRDRILIPAEALNDDRRFIDDVAFEDVAAALAPARVIAAHDLIAGMREP